MRNLRIITRNSRLARKQVEEVFSRFPDIEPLIIPCKSFGDKHKKISLMDTVPGDFFTRELDRLLLAGKGDVAVHSAKDLPMPLAPGLALAALLEAGDQTDSLVSKNSLTLKKLPQGARIGTSSGTRKKQLLDVRPDLAIIPVRGTVEERIALVDRGRIDALIVATCALQRLGLSARIAEVLPFATHPLQGHIAVVCKHDRPDMKALFNPVDVRRSYGKVYLVGAGTGSRESLTLKADETLKNADVILYDDLLADDILLPYNARKIYVGKRKGQPHVSQDEINVLLFKEAQKPQVVVRLKGGDPFIFGRGGEELAYLKERHVDAEVIPGISAAQAAAAAAQVPLTMRTKSSKVSFLSGHHAKEDPSRGETRVFYMAASRLKEISSSLQKQGMHAGTPVALIRRAGFSDEEIIASTVKGLAAHKGTSPLIMIAGPTAGLHAGRQKLLFTGLEPWRCLVAGKLVHYPLIETKPLPCSIDADTYDGIVFTSRIAVRSFCQRYGISSKQKILSIGPSTTRELKAFGCLVAITSPVPDSDVLAQEVRKLKLKKILYPCSAISRNALHRLPNVETKTVYTTVNRKQARINLGDFSGIVFTSPSTVTAFLAMYKKIPKHLVLYVYGKHTAAMLQRKGYGENVQTVSLS